MIISKVLNLSISQRLAAGFGFLLLLMLALAVGSALELRSLTWRMSQIVQVNNKQTSLANDLLSVVDAMAIQSRSIALVVDITTVGAEVTEFERLLATYEVAEKSLGDALSVAGADEASRALFAEISSVAGQVLPGIRQAVKQGAESASVEAAATLDKVRPLETNWRRKVAEFVALQKARASEAVTAAQQRRDQTAVVGFVLVLSALVSGFLVASWITLGIRRPIQNAILVAERIAEGDLTTVLRVDNSDEIGRLLKAIASMQEQLRKLVDQIRGTASSIQTASAEVASGNAELSQRTEQTAAKLQLISANMSQLTSMVRQSANAAVRANELASSAAAVALQGGDLVTRVISAMDEINAGSQKIADIISVIDGIAFQTNILALNAAVESAHAGEQGRGFAVVAGEVRSLAQRSADAAQEIKNLIGSSAGYVKTGTRLVGDAGVTMAEIVAGGDRVQATLAEISAVASEQSAGIDHVHDAIVELDTMTQQNSALVEESAAAAESLKDQAIQLAGMVSVFRLEGAY